MSVAFAESEVILSVLTEHPEVVVCAWEERGLSLEITPTEMMWRLPSGGRGRLTPEKASSLHLARSKRLLSNSWILRLMGRPLREKYLLHLTLRAWEQPELALSLEISPDEAKGVLEHDAQGLEITDARAFRDLLSSALALGSPSPRLEPEGTRHTWHPIVVGTRARQHMLLESFDGLSWGDARRRLDALKDEDVSAIAGKLDKRLKTPRKTRTLPEQWLINAMEGRAEPRLRLGDVLATANIKTSATHDKIRTLEPLKRFALQLETIYFNGTNVSDLSPVAALHNLTSFSIRHGRNIEDYTPLSQLTRLKRLSLYDTSVVDLSPFSALSQLESFASRHTSVAELTPLSNLTALVELDLYGCKVTDLNPILTLRRLQKLVLISAPVMTLELFGAFPELTSLAFSWRQRPECGALPSLPSIPTLQSLSVYVVPLVLERLTPYLKSLTYLRLNSSRLKDPRATFPHFEQLSTLELGRTNFVDLTTISHLKTLQDLDLSFTSVSDLSPLQLLPNLKKLRLEQCHLDHDAVHVLESLTELAELDLRNADMPSSTLDTLTRALPRCWIRNPRSSS